MTSMRSCTNSDCHGSFETEKSHVFFSSQIRSKVKAAKAIKLQVQALNQRSVRGAAYPSPAPCTEENVPIKIKLSRGVKIAMSSCCRTHRGCTGVTKTCGGSVNRNDDTRFFAGIFGSKFCTLINASSPSESANVDLFLTGNLGFNVLT